MKSVENLIGELLLRHNCVIVPTFGGFVAKQVSARIDFQNGTMSPPGKSLLFNRQLVNNDGLLINEYAVANNLSFDQASIAVRHKIASWNEDLKSGGRIEIDKVGRLFFDAEKNMCFEQDRFYNLLLESFGLGKVHFLTEEDIEIVEHTFRLMEEHDVEIAHKNPEPVAETVTGPRGPELRPIQKEVEPHPPKVVPHPEVEKKSHAWRYIAAACLLPIAFYSFWLPLKTDVLESGVISINDFNPFHTEEASVYKKSALHGHTQLKGTEEVEGLAENVEQLSSYTMKYDEEHYIPVKTTATEEKASTDSQKEAIEKEARDEVVNPNMMHYIVGCFGNKSNAQRLVKSLKKEGLNAKIVDYQNGLHRVASGSALSEEALNELAKKSKKLGHPGWVLR